MLGILPNFHVYFPNFRVREKIAPRGAEPQATRGQGDSLSPAAMGRVETRGATVVLFHEASSLREPYRAVGAAWAEPESTASERASSKERIVVDAHEIESWSFDSVKTMSDKLADNASW